jgi:hypothetical protein
MQKKELTDSEKQRLLWKISILIGKPFLFATTTTLSYSLFIIVYSNFINKIEFMFSIFLISLIFGFVYYLIKSGSLFLDLIKDYNSSEKTLGSFKVTDKLKLINNYYIKTEDPNFPKLKTDIKIFTKIPKGENMDLIISSSNRIYRYNPLIENFRIDKLI